MTADKGGNGSFFGKGSQQSDVLQIQVEWTDGTGAASEGQSHAMTSYATVWQQGVPARRGGGS